MSDIITIALTTPDPVIHAIEIIGLGPEGPTGPTGATGAGLPANTDITRVGNYIEYDFNGTLFHQRLLAGAAPLS